MGAPAGKGAPSAVRLTGGVTSKPKTARRDICKAAHDRTNKHRECRAGHIERVLLLTTGAAPTVCLVFHDACNRLMTRAGWFRDFLTIKTDYSILSVSSNPTTGFPEYSTREESEPAFRMIPEPPLCVFWPVGTKFRGEVRAKIAGMQACSSRDC